MKKKKIQKILALKGTSCGIAIQMPTKAQINIIERHDTIGLNLISPTNGALNFTQRLLSSLNPKPEIVNNQHLIARNFWGQISNQFLTNIIIFF